MIDRTEMRESGIEDDDWQWRCEVRSLNNEEPECPDCRGSGTRLQLMARGYGYERVACGDCGGTGLLVSHQGEDE